MPVLPSGLKKWQETAEIGNWKLGSQTESSILTDWRYIAVNLLLSETPLDACMELTTSYPALCFIMETKHPGLEDATSSAHNSKQSLGFNS